MRISLHREPIACHVTPAHGNLAANCVVACARRTLEVCEGSNSSGAGGFLMGMAQEDVTLIHRNTKKLFQHQTLNSHLFESCGGLS